MTIKLRKSEIQIFKAQKLKQPFYKIQKLKPYWFLKNEEEKIQEKNMAIDNQFLLLE